MIVKTAKHSGFCFGVRRAVGMTEQILQGNNRKDVYCLGPLIHNDKEIERLKKSGLKVISDFKGLKKGYLIIRSHGVSPEIMRQIKTSRLKVVDATCPRVRKAQQIAADLRKKGYKIIIVGDKNHPEVRALKGYAGGQAVVLNSVNNVLKVKTAVNDKIGLLAQTTQDTVLFRMIAAEFLNKNVAELRIFETICEASAARQASAAALSVKVDVMIVLGGKKSANTKRLVALCRGQKVRTFHIEDPDKIKKKWFRRCKKIGVVAGASTPDWVIKAAIEKIKK